MPLRLLLSEALVPQPLALSRLVVHHLPPLLPFPSMLLLPLPLQLSLARPVPLLQSPVVEGWR